jgi:hypothetical protein
VSRLRAGAWLRSAGVGLVFLSAVGYRSVEHPEVLGLWSPMFVIILAMIAILWIAAMWHAIRRQPGRSEIAVARMASLDVATLALGLGYAMTAAATPLGAGRVANLNLFGSEGLVPAFLEWIALVGFVAWAGLGCGPWLVRRGWSGPALLGGTLALLGLLAEGAVRLQAHILPTLEGVPTFSTSEWARRYIRRNRDGYRDIDHQEAAGGRRRVLVIGDSFGMGVGVEHLGDRFGEQLARGLGKATGVEWESITAAEADRDTRQELEMLHGSLHYCPDLVVLLYVFNDIDYLVPVTRRPSLFENATLRARFSPIRIAFLNSYLFQKLYVWGRLLLIRGSRGPSAAVTAYRDSAMLARHFDDLHRYVDAASRDGAAAVIVPFEVAGVADSAIASMYDHFVRRGLEAGLPIVRIDSAFRGRSLDELTLNAKDRHPTALAHHLAAAAAVDRLQPYFKAQRPRCAR